MREKLTRQGKLAADYMKGILFRPAWRLPKATKKQSKSCDGQQQLFDDIPIDHLQKKKPKR